MKKDLESIVRTSRFVIQTRTKKVYKMTVSEVKVYIHNIYKYRYWSKSQQMKMWKDLILKIENLPIPEERKLEHKKHIQKKLDYINQKPKPH